MFAADVLTTASMSGAPPPSGPDTGPVGIPAAAQRYTLADLPRRFVFDESQVVIGELLGQGSFGNVYKGTLNGLPVCVKVRQHASLLSIR